MARGNIMMGHHLVISADERDVKIKGIPAKEPAFGLPAMWITERDKDTVQAKGYVVVDPATVITTHLTELIKSYADEILGRHEVQELLDNLDAAVSENCKRYYSESDSGDVLYTGFSSAC